MAVIMVEKGFREDGYDSKLLDFISGKELTDEVLEEVAERTKRALEIIQQKMLDSFYITDSDCAYYIVALENLLEVFKARIDALENGGQGIKRRIEQIREIVKINLITTKD